VPATPAKMIAISQWRGSDSPLLPAIKNKYELPRACEYPPVYFVFVSQQRGQGVRKHERRYEGKISEDRTRRGRRNLLAGLSAGPPLAVRLDLARWSGRLLFPDDLRDLCGAGLLFGLSGKEPRRQPQPHLFHNLVKRRACRNHGNAGAFRQWRAWPSRGRCSRPVPDRGRLVGALAEGRTVHRGDSLTVIAAKVP